MTAGWQGLEKLADEFGDSFYLLDSARFEANCDRFVEAFERHYSRIGLAYSYKTNYLPVLCRAIEARGGYAEVVSAMEYELARKLDIPGSRIIFNGPMKDSERMIEALGGGAIVNLDSPAEVAAVEAASVRFPESTLRVGLRLHLGLEGEEVSRFGMSLDGSDIPGVLARLRALPNCKVRGLHCHLLTRRRSAADYRRIAEKMLRAADDLLAPDELEFIDIGGGFLSSMPESLARQFDFDIPSFEDYGRAVAKPFAERFGTDGPELILEPGIAVTADVLRFAARVVDCKRTGERQCAVLAGSVYNIKPTKSPRELPFEVVSEPGRSSKSGSGASSDIVGYTCMEDDVLARGFSGALAVGDWVVFENVGAYTLVLKPPFIVPAPPVLAVDRELSLQSVARRQETTADVFSTYTF